MRRLHKSANLLRLYASGAAKGYKFMKQDIRSRISHIVTYILVVSIIASAVVCNFTVNNISAFAAAEIWDGKSAEFTEGDGTAANPYKIKNGGQLYKMAQSEGKDSSGKALYYEITEDIYLNDVNSGSYTNDWVKNVYSNDNYRFIGTVDGNCHTVYGLYANNKWKNRIALFPYLGANAAVKNIRLSNAKLTTTLDSKVYIGTVAAQVKGANVTVSGCSSESSEIMALNASSVVGGIIASAESSAPVIENCAFIGTLNKAGAAVTAGGIVGLAYSNNAKVRSCYSVGSFPIFSDNATNIQKYTCENLYTNVSAENSDIKTKIAEYSTVASLKTKVDGYSAVLTDAQMQGESARTNMSGLDFDNIWEITSSYPTLRAVVKNPNAWDGNTAEFTEGSGTKEDPYKIANGGQLFKMMTSQGKDADGNGLYYEITEDIDLGGVSGGHNWKIKNTQATVTDGNYSFTGHLDGKGHTIKGMYLAAGTDIARAALIPALGAGATVTNVIISGANINATADKSYAAAITAEVRGKDVTVSSCFVDSSSVFSAKGNVGGIICAAKNNAPVINNCGFTGTLKKTDGTAVTAGGIVALVYSSKAVLNNCYSVGAYPVDSDNATNIQAYTCKNVYSDKSADAVKGYSGYPDWLKNNVSAYSKALTTEQMTGENARANMTGFDFDKVWSTTATYPVPRTVIINDNVWDGKSEDFEDGEGTKKNPYQIKTGGQLFKMMTSGGKDADGKALYYTIKNDIYLNDVDNGVYTNDWVNNDSVNGKYSFIGNVDGNGNTIYGLYASNGNKSRIGLFPYLGEGAVIRNIRISNSSLNATAASKVYVGAVAGQIAGKNVEISGCAVESTTVSAKTEASVIGGIIGSAYGKADVSVTNCYFNGTLKKNNTEVKAGGIVGLQWSNPVKLNNCYSIGSFPINADNATNIQQFVCKNLYSDVKAEDAGIGCYNDCPDTLKTAIGNWVAVLTAEQMQGENAKENMQGFEWGRIWETVDGGYPVLVKRSGSADVEYAGGEGTKADPYQIETVAQLRRMVTSSAAETSGKYYILTKDIYINDTTDANWLSNNPSQWVTATIIDYNAGTKFCGTFNGQGYTVHGIYANISGELQYDTYAGLIPILGKGAHVLNVRVSDCVIEGSALPADKTRATGVFAGAVAGQVKITEKLESESDWAKISGCGADETVKLNARYVGGILGGANKGTMMDACYFRGSASSSVITDKEIEVFSNGLLGNTWSSADFSLSNSYAVGKSLFRTEPEVYLNCYTVSETELDSIKGENAKTVMPNLDWANIWNTVADAYPELENVSYNYDGREPYFDTAEKGEVWGGKVAKYFASGTGTESNPYIIETAGQLAKLLRLTANSDIATNATKGKYYKLTADIKLNDTSKSSWKDNANEWFDSKNYNQAFFGNLDGNGHIVSGIYINVNRETSAYGALIPVIAEGAVIKNIGVTNSHIKVLGDGEKHAGAISAFVRVYEYKNTPEDKYPVISHCFADSTVTLEAYQTGGILASSGRSVKIDTCFFTGKMITSAEKRGSILGYTWVVNEGTEISNCYAAMQDYGSVIQTSRKDYKVDFTKYTDCYSASPQYADGITRVYIDGMRGNNAVKNMKAFDFENVWLARDGETPGLRIFDKNSYNNENHSDNVSVSFSTDSEVVVAPINGVSSQPMTLPVPVREGYRFDGWYVYPELDVPFTMTTFPFFSMTVYAKWSLVGIKQDFESFENTEYDLGEDYEYFRPQTAGYSSRYVYDGAKSMHRIGATADDSDFLLFYRDSLEVGRTYVMKYWVLTDEDDTKATVSLVHATWPDINEPNVGVQKMADIKGLVKGEWKEYTYTFTAKTKWISIRTTGNASLYFDNFFLIPVGYDAGNITLPATGNTAIAVWLSAIMLAGAAAVTFYRVKKTADGKH